MFPPEDLPGSRLFEEFCGDTIKRWQLGDRVIKAKVTRIQPKSGRFRLWFEDGKSAIARRVIVAAGSRKPHLSCRTFKLHILRGRDAHATRVLLFFDIQFKSRTAYQRV
ncbi:hypothetical protein [Microcoleus sp. OTE_8_concoct_300]|uniref:hypothetical protein n=1 Tax=Microcoleus sp. OTE_8_concoct_300 TaxID=2964710 RepID=UPI00403FAE15